MIVVVVFVLEPFVHQRLEAEAAHDPQGLVRPTSVSAIRRR